MGNVGSKDPFPGMKVLLIGLDSVGRGTILEKLELGEVTTEYIVLTMSVQRVAQGSTSFVSWVGVHHILVVLGSRKFT